MVGDFALVVIDQSHIIPRVAMEHPPPANKDNNRPRNASPAAIATIIKDETPIIGLHDIHVGRDMKIMQANQRFFPTSIL